MLRLKRDMIRENGLMTKASNKRSTSPPVDSCRTRETSGNPACPWLLAAAPESNSLIGKGGYLPEGRRKRYIPETKERLGLELVRLGSAMFVTYGLSRGIILVFFNCTRYVFVLVCDCKLCRYYFPPVPFEISGEESHDTGTNYNGGIRAR